MHAFILDFYVIHGTDIRMYLIIQTLTVVFSVILRKISKYCIPIYNIILYVLYMPSFSLALHFISLSKKKTANSTYILSTLKALVTCNY